MRHTSQKIKEHTAASLMINERRLCVVNLSCIKSEDDRIQIGKKKQRFIAKLRKFTDLCAQNFNFKHLRI